MTNALLKSSTDGSMSLPLLLGILIVKIMIQGNEIISTNNAFMLPSGVHQIG